MQILVTGGAGFLGSLVCKTLVEKGFFVDCLDNFSTGRRDNIKDLLSNSRFRLIEQDIRSPLPQEDYSQIWNLACPASPPAYQKDPVGTMLTNVIGVNNILSLAKAKKARILQASTSEIYGDPEISLQHEEYRGSVNTTGPRACYDEGKRAAEALCFDYKRLYQLDVRVARIFNTYGPQMDPNDGRVVSNFIVSALKNQPITIYGSGNQTRSFCYRDDLIDGFMRLMDLRDMLESPINLGNPAEFKISDLAQVVLRETNSKSSLTYLDLPIDDPKQRRPDINKARKILGWEPLVPLETGIRKTIKYFKEELNKR